MTGQMDRKDVDVLRLMRPRPTDSPRRGSPGASTRRSSQHTRTIREEHQPGWQATPACLANCIHAPNNLLKDSYNIR